MKKETLTICPICKEKLVITSLECKNCNTEYKGEFHFSKLASLNKEQADFALIFIKNAGNIKAIEKELNISYPTVKKNLDDLISALGFNKVEISEEKTFNNKKEVLQAIRKGELSLIEAEKIINEMEE